MVLYTTILLIIQGESFDYVWNLTQEAIILNPPPQSSLNESTSVLACIRLLINITDVVLVRRETY